MNWKIKAFDLTGNKGFVARPIVRTTGKPDARFIVLVDINGTVIPFYTSSSLAGKKGPDGKLFGRGQFFPVIGIGFDPAADTMWYNKSNYTWDGEDSKYAIDTYYGMPELGKIAEELNKRIDYDALLAEATDAEFLISAADLVTETNQSMTALGIIPYSTPIAPDLNKHIDLLRTALGL